MSRLIHMIDKYLNESSKLDIIKVVNVDGKLELKVKGSKYTIGVGDGISFKDTPNVKKAGFEPDTGGDIIKILKNGNVQIEGNTDKRENVKKILTIKDIYVADD